MYSSILSALISPQFFNTIFSCAAKKGTDTSTRCFSSFCPVTICFSTISRAASSSTRWYKVSPGWTLTNGPSPQSPMQPVPRTSQSFSRFFSVSTFLKASRVAWLPHDTHPAAEQYKILCLNCSCRSFSFSPTSFRSSTVMRSPVQAGLPKLRASLQLFHL